MYVQLEESKFCLMRVSSSNLPYICTCIAFLHVDLKPDFLSFSLHTFTKTTDREEIELIWNPEPTLHIVWLAQGIVT